MEKGVEETGCFVCSQANAMLWGGAGVRVHRGPGTGGSLGLFPVADGASSHSQVNVRPTLLQTGPWALQKGSISMAISV